MTTRNSIPFNEPKWKFIERVASLLESSLSPHAKVDLNVFLPVLGSEGDERQCDVVITYGEYPRQTKAIVEVQKRKSKPKINEFDGWVQKMRDVGAQHLICVSERGYPQSIINKAIRMGPTIRLLTLEELRDEVILPGVAFLGKVVAEERKFSAEPLGQILLDGIPSAKFKASDKVFGYDDSADRSSLNELLQGSLRKYELSLIKKGLKIPERYTIEIRLGSDQNNGLLWIYEGKKRFRVFEYPLKVDVQVSSTEIPLTSFSYKEDLIDGIPVWIMLAKGNVNEKEYEIPFIFRYNKNGSLQFLKRIQPEGVSANLILYPNKASAEAGLGSWPTKRCKSPSEAEQDPI